MNRLNKIVALSVRNNFALKTRMMTFQTRQIFITPTSVQRIQPSILSYPVRDFAKKSKDNKKEKNEKEKAAVQDEFAGKELDDVKADYVDELEGCIEELEETLAGIKSGRASPNIFNDLEVKAYGEMTPMQDVCSVSVQGTSNLVVKVFDESIKEEVVKALQKSEFDMSLQIVGSDIKIKLSTSRAEHVQAGIKKAKTASENFKREARNARQSAMQTLKKLAKILPSEQLKLLEKDFEALLTKTEKNAQTIVQAKEKEIQG